MSPNGKRGVAIVLCLLLVAYCGLLIRGKREDREFQAVAAEQAQTISTLRSERSAIRARPSPEPAVGETTLPSANATVTSPPPNALRETLELLQDGLLGQMDWPAMFYEVPMNAAPGSSARRTIDSAMESLAHLLELSSDESRALLDAVGKGRESFARAITASARVTREGGTVTIELPDLTQATAVFESMQAEVANILGPDRLAIYEGLGASKAMTDAFDRMGMNGVTLRISREARGISITRRTQSLSGVSIGSSTTVGGDRDDLRVNIGPLESLLPADF